MKTYLAFGLMLASTSTSNASTYLEEAHATQFSKNALTVVGYIRHLGGSNDVALPHQVLDTTLLYLQGHDCEDSWAFYLQYEKAGNDFLNNAKKDVKEKSRYNSFFLRLIFENKKGKNSISDVVKTNFSVRLNFLKNITKNKKIDLNDFLIVVGYVSKQEANKKNETNCIRIYNSPTPRVRKHRITTDKEGLRILYKYLSKEKAACYRPCISMRVSSFPLSIKTDVNNKSDININSMEVDHESLPKSCPINLDDMYEINLQVSYSFYKERNTETVISKPVSLKIPYGR